MDYTVDVTIGDTWTMTSDSRTPAPDPGAGVWTLDDYRHSWTMPEGYPSQPEPATCTLRLGSTDVQLLPPLNIGTPVSVVVNGWFGIYGPYPLGRFDGRISDAVARTKGAGLEVEVTCVDYTADLAEEYVGAEPWPEEYPDERLDRIMAAAGLDWSISQVWDVFDGFRAMDVDHRTVADLLEEHLSQLTRQGGFLAYGDWGYRRGIVYFHVGNGYSPEADPEPVGSIQWEQQLLSERTSSGGPLVLTDGPEGLTVTPVPTPASEFNVTATRQVPAALVDLNVEWRRNKGTDTNRVTVNGEFAGIFGELGPSLLVTVPSVTEEHPDVVAERGPVTATKDSTLLYVHAAKAMAAMYLPPREDLESRWAVESFTLYASRLESWSQGRLIFPLLPSAETTGGYGTSAQPHPAGSSVVVYGLRPGQNPAGGDRDWMAGRLAGADLRIQDGQVLVDVHLDKSVPRAGYAYLGAGTEPYLTLAWAGMLAGPYAGTTWAEVDPDLTWEDLRVARNG